MPLGGRGQEWSAASSGSPGIRTTKKHRGEGGRVRMTREVVLMACKERQQYTTPRLNDNLYLQCFGFEKIENLEEYTGTKALWLEENNLRSIENIGHMQLLRCLFLQSNAITRITSLSRLKSLQMINLSNNLITRLENLAGIPKLHTLEISRNRLTTLSDISHLLLCRSITVLDLSFNRLSDARSMTVWEGMQNLHVLYLQGNPVTQQIADVWGGYRKYVLARIPALTFLDERPVQTNEHRTCAAWNSGGIELEMAERALIHDESETAHSLQANRARIEETRERRRNEIRARRIAMGVDPEVPAFSSRGRLGEHELRPARSESVVGGSVSAESGAGAARGREMDDGAVGAEGTKVRYFRMPDGSLLRQRDVSDGSLLRQGDVSGADGAQLQAVHGSVATTALHCHDASVVQPGSSEKSAQQREGGWRVAAGDVGDGEATQPGVEDDSHASEGMACVGVRSGVEEDGGADGGLERAESANAEGAGRDTVECERGGQGEERPEKEEGRCAQEMDKDNREEEAVKSPQLPEQKAARLLTHEHQDRPARVATPPARSTAGEEQPGAKRSSAGGGEPDGHAAREGRLTARKDRQPKAAGAGLALAAEPGTPQLLPDAAKRG